MNYHLPNIDSNRESDSAVHSSHTNPEQDQQVYYNNHDSQVTATVDEMDDVSNRLSSEHDSNGINNSSYESNHVNCQYLQAGNFSQNSCRFQDSIFDQQSMRNRNYHQQLENMMLPRVLFGTQLSKQQQEHLIEEWKQLLPTPDYLVSLTQTNDIQKRYVVRHEEGSKWLKEIFEKQNSLNFHNVDIEFIKNHIT